MPHVPWPRAVVLLLALATPAVADGEAFEREVRPLLVEKCVSCHDAKKARGGLRLTDRASLLRGGDSGPAVVPGKPGESRLVQAVEYHGDLKMPPKGKLSAAEIDKLKRWVAAGAAWPEGKGSRPESEAFRVTDKQRSWWAWQPVAKVVPPTSAGASAIDGFLLAELDRRGITPSPLADRRTLIRRVTFDLTGLPPSPDEIDAFVTDPTPDAFARVVDRLLASPAYGQRWARHWLDVVRYTDYHDGNPAARTASCEPLNAWRYRDWVVDALNRDLPFDDFIIHQISGDLLPVPAGQEFYADGLVATTFLTNGSWDRGDADKEKMVSDMVDDQIDTVGKAFLGLTLGCARCHDHKFDPISQADYYGLAGIFYSTRILQDIGTKGGEYTLQRIPLAPKAYVARREEQLRRLKEKSALKAELLPEPPVAEAAQDGGTPGGLFPKVQDVPIHIRGSYTRLGPVVPRRMPTHFAGERQPAIKSGSGRLELARWIASPANPLTARVIVNRLWGWHFGTALARTPNNLGLLAEPPSHPALLDWLAARFVEDGWSLKRLHRRILLSAAYRRSSRGVRDRDPDNRWLGRYPVRRLEAEAIRDAMLAVAGKLDRTPGGPASADLHINRRSLYVQTARWDRSSYATLFDAANPDASVEARGVSTVAPQALFLLNHDFALRQAGALAERLAREVPGDAVARLQLAGRLLFGRPLTADEVAVVRPLLARAGIEGWRDVAHVLLCGNEFVYLD